MSTYSTRPRVASAPAFVVRTQACSESPSSSNRLLLALCQRACATIAPASSPAEDVRDQSRTGGTTASEAGFSPILLPPASFAALARLLRACLDQAASGREFLQARNCLLTSGLFAVRGAEYVAWLRNAEGGDDLLAVMADSELVSAAGALDHQQQQQQQRDKSEMHQSASSERGGVGGGDAGEVAAAAVTAAAAADYLLQRELRRHRVWRTIELWEVSMSDSVVMAMDGGGARAERWLPAAALAALNEVGA